MILEQFHILCYCAVELIYTNHSNVVQMFVKYIFVIKFMFCFALGGKLNKTFFKMNLIHQFIKSLIHQLWLLNN